ncbi:hypothetical protein NUSPORA_00972 [Nucleospora cyclopteri]
MENQKDIIKNCQLKRESTEKLILGTNQKREVYINKDISDLLLQNNEGINHNDLLENGNKMQINKNNGKLQNNEGINHNDLPENGNKVQINKNNGKLQNNEGITAINRMLFKYKNNQKNYNNSSLIINNKKIGFNKNQSTTLLNRNKTHSLYKSKLNKTDEKLIVRKNFKQIPLISENFAGGSSNQNYFNNLLVNLSIEPEKTLKVLIRLRKYTAGDLTSFLIAAKVIRFDDENEHLISELIFELFIRMTDILSLKKEDLSEKSLRTFDKIISNDCSYISSLALRYLNVEKDRRINILAFICYKIVNREISSMTFTYDIYCLVELIYTDYDINKSKSNEINDLNLVDQQQVYLNRDILLNWSLSNPSKYKLFRIDQNAVFADEIKYISDFDLLLELLVNKSCYELVLIKIEFLLKTVYNVNINLNECDKLRKLENVLIEIYCNQLKKNDQIENQQFDYLEKIFDRLKSPKSIIYFIIKTQSSLFYQTFFANCCNEINCYFIDALLINFDKLDFIPHNVLISLIKSPFFKYTVSEYKNFLKMINLMADREILIFSMETYRKEEIAKLITDLLYVDANPMKNKIEPETALNVQSLRKTSVFKKILFLIKTYKNKKYVIEKPLLEIIGKIYYKELKAVENKEEISTIKFIVEIFFMVENIKFIREVIKVSEVLLITEIKNRKITVFIIECLKYLITANKMKFKDISDICIPNNDNFARIANKILGSNKNEHIKSGIYLNNSHIKIQNLSGNFTLIVKIIEIKSVICFKINNDFLIEFFEDQNDHIIDKTNINKQFVIKKGDTINFTYKNQVIKLKVNNGEVYKTTIKEIKKINIKAEKEASFKDLLFYESAVPIPITVKERDFYQVVLKPLYKMLEQKQKKGIYYGPQILQLGNNKIDLITENVLLHN